MTRDEAIKILKELAGYEKTMDLIQNYSVSVQDALYMAIKALEQETVTEFADRCRECGARYGRLLNQKWIPVSERLPNIADVYRVTRYFPNNVMNPEYLVDACFFDGSNTWYNDNRINHERAYVNNVIAWQENPEPYKVEPQERKK